MIAIDTNLLVRHLTQDDPPQAAKVAALLAKATADDETVFLADIVLCEIWWVLARFYGVKRTDLLTALKRVLADPLFTFQNRTEITAALLSCQAGKGHFADHLISNLARSAGCRITYTFEKGLGPAAGFSRL